MDLIPLTGEVIDDGAEVGEITLRDADAIHLASALSIRADLATFIVYDDRLGQAASAAGLNVLAPGRDAAGLGARAREDAADQG